MIILGVDPGFASLGYSVINADASGDKILEYGVISTVKNSKKEVIGLRVINDDKERLFFIYKKLIEIINKYNPNVISMEGYGPRPGKGKGWKGCFGFLVAIIIAFQRNIETLVFISSDIKIRVGENYKASKEDVQKKVEQYFKIKIKSKKKYIEHIGDSLALCILAKNEMSKLSGIMKGNI